MTKLIDAHTSLMCAHAHAHTHTRKKKKKIGLNLNFNLYSPRFKLAASYDRCTGVSYSWWKLGGGEGGGKREGNPTISDISASKKKKFWFPIAIILVKNHGKKRASFFSRNTGFWPKNGPLQGQDGVCLWLRQEQTWLCGNQKNHFFVKYFPRWGEAMFVLSFRLPAPYEGRRVCARHADEARHASKVRVCGHRQTQEHVRACNMGGHVSRARIYNDTCYRISGPRYLTPFLYFVMREMRRLLKHNHKAEFT